MFTFRGHLDYGFCQIGTSGMIFEDDSAIIGAPGPKTWRGAVFISSLSDDFLGRDKQVYLGVEQQVTADDENELPDAHIRKYAYMGKCAKKWRPSLFLRILYQVQKLYSKANRRRSWNRMLKSKEREWVKKCLAVGWMVSKGAYSYTILTNSATFNHVSF